MPYYKKRYKKSYTGRKGKKFGFGKFARYASYALAAYKMAKYLKGVINVEYKYKDTAANAANITTTPAITLLNLVNQGDTSQSRDGDSIKMVSLDLNVNLLKNVSSTSVNQIKVCLIKKDPTNGVAPTNTDIWDTTTGSLSLVKRNLAYTDSLKVIKKWDVILAQGVKEGINLKCNLKLNQHVKYKGSAQTVADIMTSSYWLYVVTDQVATFPTYAYTCRIRFIDN